jgi:hypothetical protein
MELLVRQQGRTAGHVRLETIVSKVYGRPDLFRGHGFDVCRVSIASMEIVREDRS